jgi:uncharacterized protein YidB (DUF937 family)
MSDLEEALGGLLGGSSGGGLGGIISSLTGGGGSGGGGAMIGALGGLLGGGGMQSLLSGLQANGLGKQADSWIGTGKNEPISGEQVRQVVGDDQVAKVAQQLGVSHDEAADKLAKVLPDVVDKASPNGQLAPQHEIDAAFQNLQRTMAHA